MHALLFRDENLVAPQWKTSTTDNLLWKDKVMKLWCVTGRIAID